jgi:RNA polymerase-binding transcription factor DksA
MVMTVEVYDDAELAEMLERAEREASEQRIRSKVFQGTQEDAIKLYVAGKECEECGDVLSKERQLAAPLSNFCPPCQSWFEDEEKRRKLKQM